MLSITRIAQDIGVGRQPIRTVLVGGLPISSLGYGCTLLRGPLLDEAALHGALITVRGLALSLLAVYRIVASRVEEADGGTRASGTHTLVMRLVRVVRQVNHATESWLQVRCA
jgi:hypothetical protein